MWLVRLAGLYKWIWKLCIWHIMEYFILSDALLHLHKQRFFSMPPLPIQWSCHTEICIFGGSMSTVYFSALPQGCSWLLSSTLLRKRLKLFDLEKSKEIVSYQNWRFWHLILENQSRLGQLVPSNQTRWFSHLV